MKMLEEGLWALVDTSAIPIYRTLTASSLTLTLHIQRDRSVPLLASKEDSRRQLFIEIRLQHHR